VARLKRAACTRASAACANAELVEQKQNRFAFNKLKTNICGIRQTIDFVAVKLCVFAVFSNPVFKLWRRFVTFCVFSQQIN
jgi:hypothetical protein